MNQILFIDDDQFISTLYSNKLREDGFEVVTVHSGAKALQLLKTMQPAAIVLDLHLPDIDGTEVLHTIRASNKLKHTPVLVLSTGYVKSLMNEVSPLEVHGIFIKSQSPPKAIIEELRKILPEPQTPAADQDPHAILANIATPAPLKTFLESDDPEAQRAALRQFYLEIRDLLGEAIRTCGQNRRGQLGRALQALLEELYDNPSRINLSTKQTLAIGFKHLKANSPNQRAKAILDSEAKLRGIVASLTE